MDAGLHDERIVTDRFDPPGCRLRVTGEPWSWQERRCREFDDTVEHEEVQKYAAHRFTASAARQAASESRQGVPFPTESLTHDPLCGSAPGGSFLSA